jgi:hypothetical protein
MPWCDSCARYWNPNSLTRKGECPDCGGAVDLAAKPGDATSSATAANQSLAGDPSIRIKELDEYKAPWHFKLMVALAAIYLVFRIIQMITWVV